MRKVMASPISENQGSVTCIQLKELTKVTPMKPVAWPVSCWCYSCLRQEEIRLKSKTIE